MDKYKRKKNTTAFFPSLYFSDGWMDDASPSMPRTAALERAGRNASVNVNTSTITEKEEVKSKLLSFDGVNYYV